MNDTQKKSTKKFLVIYCIAIFTCAVALILLASFSHSRITREADEIKGRLESAEILAADSKTRLDAVMTENSRLSDKITSLTAEKDELLAYKETAEKRIAAATKLNEILNLKLTKKTKALNAAIKSFNESGYFAHLSAENQKIYNSIK